MKKTTLVITLLLCIIFTESVLAQKMLREIPLQQQIEQSSLIVEGKVIAKKSFWDDNNHNIYTANTIEVYKVFKGEQLKTIEVITIGGVVGYEALIAYPSLKLRKGDVGVFTLYDNNIPVELEAKSSNKKYRTYSSLQGFYRYNLQDNIAVNPFNKKKGISNSFYNEIMNYTKSNFVEISEFSTNNNSKSNQAGVFLPPAAITFAPTTGTAGTKTVLTISGSGFGAIKGKVGFSNADDGGATFIDALDTQVLTWSDTEITVEIPSDAGTGTIRVTHDDTTTGTSVATLTITYSQQNAMFNPGGGMEAYQTQHIDRNGNGGYIWQMHTDFDANAAAKASFLSAFESWRCETGVNWDNGATTATDVIANDDINIVRFDNGTELGAGVLGRCTSRWSGCSGATIEWYVEELDIVFDDGTSWYYGSGLPAFTEYDFESVALHELGHGHQLGHVIDIVADGDNMDDVMHYAISNSEQQRVLTANNIAGANDVQSRSTGTSVCGESVMTDHSCSLSVEDEELNNAISLYPNPAKNQFYIKNASFSINLEKVVIYDISGRLISEYDLSNTSKTKTIKIQNASKGIYFVNIHSDSAVVTKKIVLD